MDDKELNLNTTFDDVLEDLIRLDEIEFILNRDASLIENAMQKDENSEER